MDDWMVLLAGERRTAVEEGKGLELRLLSASEVLEARREAERLAQEGRERALCSNACLLARALERGGKPLFPDGGAVLKGLTVERIGSLSRQWADFSRRENPSPEEGERAETLKKLGAHALRAPSMACAPSFWGAPHGGARPVGPERTGALTRPGLRPCGGG